MSMGARLNRLEAPTRTRTYAVAKQELLRRLERADPETKARVLTAIREMQKRDP